MSFHNNLSQKVNNSIGNRCSKFQLNQSIGSREILVTVFKEYNLWIQFSSQ